MIQAAMTIDVEEYYHVSAFEGTIPRDDWPTLPPRAAESTHRLLDLFAVAGAKATFFTLSCVARAHPALIRRMVQEGHEVASHGVDHRRVGDLGQAGFLADLTDSRAALEDAAGAPVQGYRAPSFSISKATPWAYEALASAGYAYSSSSNPIRHDHYGDAEAPREPHWRDGILEIPVTTLSLGGRRFAAGGGGFFRLLPGGWFRLAARRAARAGLTPNFYLHPWEIDPGQPRVKAAPLKARARHYVGLSRCESKLKRHLAAFRWGRMDHLYAFELKGDSPCAA